MNPPVLYSVQLAESAGAIGYTNCITTEGEPLPSNDCPRYGTKQSVGEVPVMLEL